jgi:hypothetical protein
MQTSSVTVNGSETQNYQGYLQVSGLFNYFVSIEVSKSPGTTNSSIVVTAFTKSNKNIAIAVKYQWFHVGANPLKDRSSLNKHGSHYQLSSVGSIDLNRPEQTNRDHRTAARGRLQRPVLHPIRTRTSGENHAGYAGHVH